MQLPYKYTIICNKTKQIIRETNIEPRLYELQTYEPTDKENVKELKQTKTVYIDTRYEAKLRLYNYFRRKEGLSTYPPKYEPFKGSEIGKTIPILNF